ncbi:MAG TPA: ABC transporter ATP-binding protein [Candidatus Dormibacteraeota bacterium]
MIRGAPGGGPGGARPAGGPGQRGFWPGMGPPPAKVKDFRRTVRQLVGRLRPEWHWVAVAILLTAVGVALTITGPRILGQATNLLFDGLVGKSLPHGLTKMQVIAGLRAHGKNQFADMLAGMNVTPGVGVDFGAVGSVLLLAAAVYALGAVMIWAQGYVMAGVTQRVVYGLRKDVERKLDHLPLAYFDHHDRGDILSRVTNDIDNIGQTLNQSLGQLLNSLLTVVGVLIMMITINLVLAVISLVVVPLSGLITVLIATRSQRRFVEQWRATGALSAHVEQMHTGHALVQVFGHRERALEEFEVLNERMYRASFAAQALSGVIQPGVQLVSNLNYVAIAVIGGWRVASGTMSLGDVQAFIVYARQFTMPIMQLAGIMNLMQSGIASAERIFELLEAEEETPDAVFEDKLPAVRGAVSFDNVSFRYEPDRPLIEDFNLEVSPGQTIAIVGPTGAGKTTMVNLLMRFYDVDRGAIRLDGVDIRELPRETLRAQFGMVLQDSWVFAGSIRENIAYGRLDGNRGDGGYSPPSQDEVVAAAEAAHFDGFVRTLPDGYDTHLDDDVSNLSAGQRQLLTIARAFIADRPILILDEATSSVDTRTEVLIQEAMAQLRRGRTSFVIAHRLSTIRNADSIIVMDHGRIVEQGSHEELIAREGFYYRLYRSQFVDAFAEVG